MFGDRVAGKSRKFPVVDHLEHHLLYRTRFLPWPFHPDTMAQDPYLATKEDLSELLANLDLEMVGMEFGYFYGRH